MTSPPGEAVREAVVAAGGTVPFATFMELALYGTGGFYTGPTAGSAGRRGDFLTAPEVGPLFGAVWARYLDAEWERIGRPDPFVVVEAGAGPGTLARSIVAAAPSCRSALRYVAVERSAAQRARHPAGIESRADLPVGPLDGVVVANELLDNLAFRLVVFDGAWREAHVAVDGERFVEVLGPPLEPVPAVLPPRPPLGARAPLLDAAAAWVDEVRQLVRRGSVVAIDYARTTTAEMAALDWRSWLRTYAGHQRGRHYLHDVGRQDITTDVPLDQLPAPTRRRPQAEFLRQWGIDELVADGAAAWSAAAAAPDVRALTMRSRRREAEALTEPAGLGAFDVLEWVS